MYNDYVSKIVKEIFWIILGNLILAFAVVGFILPNDILSGGVAGIAVLLQPFLPLKEEFIITVVNTLLFVVGFLFLGKRFAVTTFLSTIVYPLFVVLLPNVLPHIELDPILAAIYAGLFGGIGIGLVLRQGASTGGMDIPPLICNRYFGIDLSKCVMVTDGLTVLLGLWIYGMEAVLIGLISVYVTGVAISKVITFGGTSAKSVEIISKEYLAISEEIHKELDRGTTILQAFGGYTKEEKPVLLVVITNKEYQQLMNIVNRFDDNAFMIVSDAQEVHGEGFSYEARI